MTLRLQVPCGGTGCGSEGGSTIEILEMHVKTALNFYQYSTRYEHETNSSIAYEKSKEALTELLLNWYVLLSRSRLSMSNVNNTVVLVLDAMWG